MSTLKKRVFIFGGTITECIRKVNAFSDYIEQFEKCDVYLQSILGGGGYVSQAVVIAKLPADKTDEVFKKADEINEHK